MLRDHAAAPKWLWKLALASAVAFAESLMVMFRLRNLESRFYWPVVFIPVWLGFLAWGYFIVKMGLDRAGRYRQREGQVPASATVIAVNVLGWLGLSCFFILLTIRLHLGPDSISDPMLLLPLFILFGALIFAPSFPSFLQRDFQQYNLYSELTPSSGGGGGASLYNPLPGVRA